MSAVQSFADWLIKDITVRVLGDIPIAKTVYIETPLRWIALGRDGESVGLVFRELNYWASLPPDSRCGYCGCTLTQHVEDLIAEEGWSWQRGTREYDGGTCDACFKGWADDAGHRWEFSEVNNQL